jgi:hypothetical protein
MSTGRIMVGDLEEQVEVPLVPLAMLAELGADVDPPTVNDLCRPGRAGRRPRHGAEASAACRRPSA